MRKTYTQEQYSKITSVTKIVGDQHYLLILLELLGFGEKSFNELRRMTGINQVTLSRKLSQLKDKGLVTAKQVGKEHHYSTTKKAHLYAPIAEEIVKTALE